MLLTDWNDLFAAQVGASAALAGLLFVGTWLNMSKLVQYPQLPDRALQALLLLVTILIISTLMLVPDQSLDFVGAELIVVGATAVGFTSTRGSRTLRRTPPEFRGGTRVEVALVILATLTYALAGLLLIVEGSGAYSGLYLLVPAFLVSFIFAIIDSWVLLVEVNR